MGATLYQRAVRDPVRGMGSVLHPPGRSVLVLMKIYVKKPVTDTERVLLVLFTLAFVAVIWIIAVS